MNELKVQITPALVTQNFDEMKAYLEIEVDKYEVEVFDHNVKEAKASATELNAVTKGINEVKKAQLEILEAPVKLFKSQIAELNDIVQKGRTKILKQVKAFEDRELEIIDEEILKKAEYEYEIQDLSEDYYGINFSDLVLLGSVTKTGNLTKKVTDEIEARVANAKKQQTAEEEEIEAQRLRLEEEVQKRLYEQRIEDAKEIRHEDKPVFNQTVPAEETIKPLEAIKEALPIVEAPEGKKVLRIAISFDIIVREGAPEEKVLNKMRELLQKVGIPELNEIKIEG